jgi:ABC-type antimicrobial peptide transport system permease subunit
MDLQILPFRLASWGAAALGLLGLALASIGIYGVMAYVVNQRTREIAIRIAVGGGPGRVLWMILRDGLRLIAIAAAAGLTIALAFSRLIRAMLFRVDAADPLTFVVAPVVLGMVGLIAIYLASRKATRVDPNVTLRAE